MRYSKTSLIPYFLVISNNKVLDFRCKNINELCYKDMWFKGRLRTRSLKAFNYEKIKENLVNVYLF
jgi:hypothetical protein